MRCEMCGTDPEVIVLLPIRQSDGRFDTLVCEDCAEKSPAYCRTHERPHIGFDDNTHACLICIETEVHRRRTQAKHYYDLIRIYLPPDEQEKLEEWLSLVISVTGDADDICVLRAAVTRAHCLGQTPESIFGSVIRERSVASLLP